MVGNVKWRSGCHQLSSRRLWRSSSEATAIAIARRTIAIARQNVWFAIGVKAAILILAVFGLGTMWMAVFADVGVTVIAVLNAMRALKS